MYHPLDGEGHTASHLENTGRYKEEQIFDGVQVVGKQRPAIRSIAQVRKVWFG